MVDQTLGKCNFRYQVRSFNFLVRLRHSNPLLGIVFKRIHLTARIPLWCYLYICYPRNQTNKYKYHITARCTIKGQVGYTILVELVFTLIPRVDSKKNYWKSSSNTLNNTSAYFTVKSLLFTSEITQLLGKKLMYNPSYLIKALLLQFYKRCLCCHEQAYFFKL